MFDTCNWKYHQLCIIHANLFGVKIHTAVSWQKFDVWKLKIINKNRRGDFEKTFNLHYYKWGICNAAWVCFIIWLFKFRINSTWPLKKKKTLYFVISKKLGDQQIQVIFERLNYMMAVNKKTVYVELILIITFFFPFTLTGETGTSHIDNKWDGVGVPWTVCAGSASCLCRQQDQGQQGQFSRFQDP